MDKPPFYCLSGVTLADSLFIQKGLLCRDHKPTDPYAVALTEQEKQSIKAFLRSC